jgi:hypothetical protein
LQYVILALRLIIERGKLLESNGRPYKLFGNEDYSGEDLEFWAYILTYYKHNVIVDDLESWTED